MPILASAGVACSSTRSSKSLQNQAEPGRAPTTTTTAHPFSSIDDVAVAVPAEGSSTGKLGTTRRGSKYRSMNWSYLGFITS